MSNFNEHRRSRLKIKKSQDPRDDLKLSHDVYKIYVSGISFRSTEPELKEIFKKAGNVINVIIPYKNNGKKCGYCYVGYEKESDMKRAIKMFNDQIIDKLPLRVTEFQPQNYTSSADKKYRSERHRDSEKDYRSEEEDGK